MKTIKATAQTIASAFSEVMTDADRKYTKSAIETVNIQAARTRQNALLLLNQNFTLRNKFTTGSVLYTQCPLSTTRIQDIQSEVGATERAEYLERQETGGPHKAPTGKQLAIPTDAARGGSKGSVVRNKYNLRKMQFVDTSSASRFNSRRARMVALAYVASNTRKLLNFKKGIFEIKNFRKTGDSISFKMQLIRNKKFSETMTSPKPWLTPASEGPAAQAQDIFNIQMAKNS